MDIAIGTHVLAAVLFGAIVAAVEGLIAGGLSLRPWLARAWVYACFCYIVLFGAIRV